MNRSLELLAELGVNIEGLTAAGKWLLLGTGTGDSVNAQSLLSGLGFVAFFKTAICN